jgi:SHAQKYF class myb-like DNA-binding protein
MFSVMPDRPNKAAKRFIINVEGKPLKQRTEFTVTNTIKSKVETQTSAKGTIVVRPELKLPEAIREETTSSAKPDQGAEPKKIKIRLSIIKDAPYNPNKANTELSQKKLKEKKKETKTKQKKINREGNYNCGRWTQEEHQRFIEAIMKYGNEWKQVQKHVGSRSSTQARSHAQKFFVKIKKSNLLDFNVDFTRNSIKTLHDLANTMNSDEYFNAIKALNCVAFERKNTLKRKQKRDENQLNDSSCFNGDSQNTLYFRYNIILL